MKLTEKSLTVLNYVMENGNDISMKELSLALNRTERSVQANVSDLVRKGLAKRRQVPKKDDKWHHDTYVVLTEDGLNYTPTLADEDYEG